MQENLRTSCRAAPWTHGVPATKSVRSENISMLAVRLVTFTVLGVAEVADHFVTALDWKSVFAARPKPVCLAQF
jgi:hypothetical protein